MEVAHPPPVSEVKQHPDMTAVKSEKLQPHLVPAVVKNSTKLHRAVTAISHNIGNTSYKAEGKLQGYNTKSYPV